VLRAHCDAEGRDYAAIEKTSMYMWDPGADVNNVEPVIQSLRWLAGMGIQNVFMSVSTDPFALKPLEVIAERIMPAVADL
jgi:hypothetical protein